MTDRLALLRRLLAEPDEVCATQLHEWRPDLEHGDALAELDSHFFGPMGRLGLTRREACAVYWSRHVVPVLEELHDPPGWKGRTYE
jgi:hypothetical protein